MTSLFAFAVVHTVLIAPQEITVSVEGVERQALVYRPTVKAGSAGSPLVFGFHGHGGSMRNAARSFQMHELWPEAAVVYMQGLPTSGRTDPEGRRAGWQISVEGNGGRDLKFFDAVLAKVRKEVVIDSNRVFAMGHSNGGRFSYVLWAARPDVFAGFGPSGSPATGLLFRMPAKPAFVIAGETDSIVPFEGQKATMEALVEKNGCGKGTKKGLLTTYESEIGAPVRTYIVPGGHAYPREANALMVEFFKGLRKSGSAS